jgi:hypothetical protein
MIVGPNNVRPRSNAVRSEMGPKALRPYVIWCDVTGVPKNVLAFRAPNPKNSVQMIGHHCKGVEFNLRPDSDGVEPLFTYNPATIAFTHLVTHHLTENA